MKMAMFSSLAIHHNMFSAYKSNILCIIPPKKITIRKYVCDCKFDLDIIIEMFDCDTIKLGVCLLSSKDYRLYIVETNMKHIDIKLISTGGENLMSSHNKGGQSQKRMERIRKIKYSKFISDVADDMVDRFMIENDTKCIVDKIIIAGPTLMKSHVLEDEYVNRYFGKKILKVISTPSISDKTIFEVIEGIDLSTDLIDDNTKEIEDLLSTKVDLLLFGIDNIKKHMIDNNISKIIIHKDYYDKYMSLLSKSSEKVKIIQSKSSILFDYDGVLGIKWFNTGDDYEI